MAKTVYYKTPSYLKPTNKQNDLRNVMLSNKDYGNTAEDRRLAQLKIDEANYIKPKIIPPVTAEFKKSYTDVKDFRLAEQKKFPTPNYLKSEIKKPLPSILPKKVVQQGKVPIKGLARPDNPAAPFLVNALNTASFGLLERNNKGIQELQKKAPISSAIGSMAGYVLPGAIGAKAIRPLTNKLGGKLLSRVAEGAFVGGATEGVSGFVGDRGIKQIAKNVGYGVALGGALDTLLYGAGQLKNLSKYKGALRNQALETNLLDADRIKSPKGLSGNFNKPKIETKIEVPSYLRPQKTPMKINNANGILNTQLKPQATISQPVSANVPTNNKLLSNKPIRIANDMTSVNMSGKAPNESFGTNIGKESAMYTPDNIQMSGSPAKVSKVYSNTLQNTDVLSRAEKDMLNTNDFTYDTKTEKMSLDAARARIQKNIDGEIRNLNNKELYSGEDVDTMMGILGDRQLPKAQETGDYTEVKNWLKNVRKAGTEGGRTVQSFAKYSRTAEGKLIEGQRVVDAVEEGLKKSNPRLIQDIDNQTKQVTGAIVEIDKAAIPQVTREIENFLSANDQFNFLDMAQEVKKTQPLLESPLKRPLTTAEKLANKIDRNTSPKQLKLDLNKDEDTLLRTLFNIAKKEIPQDVAKTPITPEELISEALKNKDKYANVWSQAKIILKERFNFDEDRISTLSGFLEKKLRPTFEQNKLNKAIAIELKNKGINMSDIVKQHYSVNSKVRTDLTETLIQKTELKGEEADYLAKFINNKMKEITKEKKEQVLKQMFKEKSKSKPQKGVVEKVNELINLGAYDRESIRDLIKTKEGLPILDSNDIKFITEWMDKSNSAIPGSYDNRMALAKVGGLIAEKTPSTGMEKFQAAQRVSMLFNFKTTAVRNPLGNTLLNSMESIKNIPGVGIDKIVSKVRGSERSTLLNPLLKGKASAKGFNTGIQEWRKDFANKVDTSPTGGGVELPNKVKIFNENAKTAVQRTINKAANKIHFIVGRALKLGDTPFYNAAYSERIAELKKIKKTDIITDAMKEDAHAYGLERTLQNDSAMANMFTGLKGANFLNNHAGAKTVYQTFANLVMPFAKTPANVLDKFIDYSPVGILKATGQGISTAGKGTFNQKKFVDTMARGLTGTGLSVLGYRMAEKGFITGARDKNSKIEGLENSLGKQNYAFKVGNEYQTIDWALPAAAPLMMGADVYNSMNKKKGATSSLIDGVGSGINLMFNSTLLQGPSRLMGGYNPAASLSSGLLGSTTQATPTIGKQIGQLVDPYIRETYDPNPLKQTLNKTINRIPFASKTLPKKVDSFGNDIKAFQGKNTIFNVMLNPGFKTTYKADDIQKEIIRLYNDSGEAAHIPGPADKIITKTKTNPEVVLTAKEMIEYSKAIALNTTSAYNMIMNTDKYKNFPDAEKAKMLASALAKAKEYAKVDMLKKKGKYWGLK